MRKLTLEQRGHLEFNKRVLMADRTVNRINKERCKRMSAAEALGRLEVQARLDGMTLWN